MPLDPDGRAVRICAHGRAYSGILAGRGERRIFRCIGAAALLMAGVAAPEGSRQILAAAGPVPGPAVGKAAAPPAVVRSAGASVFLLETHDWFGSGFLVDESGLILTDANVIGDARTLAVRIGARERFTARVVTIDEESGLAVVKVNAGVLPGIGSLPLYPDGTAGGKAACWIVGAPEILSPAILPVRVPAAGGKPIDLGSAVGRSAAGAPVLDGTGRVVGVVTVSLGKSPEEDRAGAIPAETAAAVVATARERAAKMSAVPAGPLAHAPESSYPEAALPSSPRQDWPDFHLKMRGIDLLFLPPSLAYSLQALAREPEAIPGPSLDLAGVFYRLRGTESAAARFATPVYNGEPVVVVQALPQLRRKETSLGHQFLPGLLEDAADDVLPGLYEYHPDAWYQFKGRFLELRLLRDGEALAPILPGRVCSRVVLPAPNETKGKKARSILCYGVYKFAPEAFRPGANMEVQVLFAGGGKPRHKRLPPALRERIWSDLAP